MELCALYVVLCVWYALTCVMCRMCMPLVIVIVYPYHFVQYVHTFYTYSVTALINVLVKYALVLSDLCVWCALTGVRIIIKWLALIIMYDVSYMQTLCAVWHTVNNVWCIVCDCVYDEMCDVLYVPFV